MCVPLIILICYFFLITLLIRKLYVRSCPFQTVPNRAGQKRHGGRKLDHRGTNGFRENPRRHGNRKGVDNQLISCEIVTN